MADAEPRRADLGRLRSLVKHFADRLPRCNVADCSVCPDLAAREREAGQLLREIEERISLLRGALQGVIEERKDHDVAMAVADFGLTRDDDYVAGRTLELFWDWYRKQESADG